MFRKKFFERYVNFMKIAIRLSVQSREEGLLALEGEVEDIEDELFKKGLRLVVDGTDSGIIDEIMSARIAHEKNKDERLLQTIKKRAVLGLQSGESLRVFVEVLNAYAGLSFKEEWKLLETAFPEEDEEEDSAKTESGKGELTADEIEAIINQEIADGSCINMPITADEDAYRFNDIAALDDRCMQAVLRNVDTQVLAVALKKAYSNVKNALFRNMSKVAAAVLKEDMEYMGDVSDEAVQEAQLTILNVVRRLNDIMEITIPASPTE